MSVTDGVEELTLQDVDWDTDVEQRYQEWLETATEDERKYQETLIRLLQEFSDSRGIKDLNHIRFHFLRVEQECINDPPEAPEWYDDLMEFMEKNIDLGDP